MNEPKRLADARIDRRTLVKGAMVAGAASAASLPGLASAATGNANTRIVNMQEDGDTLIIAAAGSPSDIDPHSSYDYQSILAILGAYEGLIGLVDDSTTEFEGLVAESWSSNEDRSVWEFKIRPGLTFQDGSPVDAEAVRLSFERFFTLGLGPVGVLTRFVSDLAQITTPDESTVVFDLGAPQPLFDSAMASTYGPMIVNAKLLRDEHEEDGDWGHFWAQTNAEGTGSGAYRITQFDPGSELQMEAFEGYWRGWDGDHFTKVIIRVVSEGETRRQLLESGDADIVDSLVQESIDAVRENPDIVTLDQFVTRNNYFAMAVTGPLESAEARQAMCYAFPYTEVLDGIYLGRARQPRGAVPPEVRGHFPETFQFSTDLEKAKELLTAAGVEEGTSMTLALQTGIEQAKSASELFKENLAQLGIDLSIEVIDLATYSGIVYGDAPVEERPNFMWWGWWPDYNDAWNHLYPQVVCASGGSAGSNMGFYCNAEVDASMEAALSAASDEEYNSALASVQQIVSLDDPAAIYYVEAPWTTMYNKRLTGVFINPINIGTYNFWKMTRTAE